ncbi:MAG: glutathione S-transferase N-terminal domain-containing protein [Bauldia sp.]|nr:glutathione S-transferase N-terminal domain-containing protein [Bauldia sp.]
MQSLPINVYYWSTPNGRKVTVMLEELAVPYTVTYVDIDKREQWTPAFERVSPNHQVPAIIDPEGPGGEPIAVFESGAILLYLGRKFGRFYPQDDERARTAVETWLMWQMGSFGPFLGQAHHFNLGAAEDVPYAIERYGAIARRLYAVLDAQLGRQACVASDAFTIADIAIYCWAARHERHRIRLADYPRVADWFERIGKRPAVVRGMAVIKPGHEDRAVVNPARATAASRAASA